VATVVRREAGEPPAAILHRVHKHILVAFTFCRYDVRPIAPFSNCSGIFSSSAVICGYVIIHGFDGFPHRPPVNDFFVVHSDDIAATFLLGFLLILFLRFYIH
jgi:hypothetical protein